MTGKVITGYTWWHECRFFPGLLERISQVPYLRRPAIPNCESPGSVCRVTDSSCLHATLATPSKASIIRRSRIEVLDLQRILLRQWPRRDLDPVSEVVTGPVTDMREVCDASDARGKIDMVVQAALPDHPDAQPGTRRRDALVRNGFGQPVLCQPGNRWETLPWNFAADTFRGWTSG